MNTNTKVVGLLVAALALGGVVGACGSGTQEHAPAASAPAGGAAGDRDAALEEHALAHARGYVCPMHPNVTSDEPGTCPICGMALVPVEAPAGGPEEPAAAAASAERRILYYRHPHRADVTSPTPRKDEMGMDYVPVYATADESAQQGPVVQLARGMQQSLGVRTARAEEGPLARRVEAVASVAYDARGTREVRVRAEGWVESREVRAAGERVRAGQVLFTVYAPKLATTRQDLERARALGDAELVAAAEARLRALGASAGNGDRVAYRAPVDGVVAELMVYEGTMVTPDMVAARITPLGRVWVVAAVPESQSAGVVPGTPVDLSFPSLPGETLTAKVGEVLPELDAATRTVQARIALDNPDVRLRPGMIGTASLELGTDEPVVHVPTDAVIRTGRDARVVLALGDGRFATRPVVTGLESGERIAIRSGLAAGEEVVVSGQFLIDSESSVRASLGRLETAPPPDAHAGHGATEQQR